MLKLIQLPQSGVQPDFFLMIKEEAKKTLEKKRQKNLSILFSLFSAKPRIRIKNLCLSNTVKRYGNQFNFLFFQIIQADCHFTTQTNDNGIGIIVERISILLFCVVLEQLSSYKKTNTFNSNRNQSTISKPRCLSVFFLFLCFCFFLLSEAKTMLRSRSHGFCV